MFQVFLTRQRLRFVLEGSEEFANSIPLGSSTLMLGFGLDFVFWV